MESLFWIARIYSFVAGVHLGPCLFEQWNPQFIGYCFGEGKRTIYVGYKLVHINSDPFAFVQHLHLVVLLLVSLCLQEQIVDAIRALSKSS